MQLWGLRISANEMEMGAVPGQHNPGPGTTMAPYPSCAPIVLDSKMSQAPDSREILELSLAQTGSLLLLLLSSCSALQEMHHRCLNTPKIAVVCPKMLSPTFPSLTLPGNNPDIPCCYGNSP